LARVNKLPIGKGHYGIPIHPVLKATISVLAPASRGTYLSPAMRLVAVTMLLWKDDWDKLSNGRYGMTAAELADRTSLTEQQVIATLAKLVDVQMVRERADGWELTIDRWQEAVLRPAVARASARTL
jgi:hypothetical protein